MTLQRDLPEMGMMLLFLSAGMMELIEETKSFPKLFAE